MYILVINCGSSSAKYDLFDVANEDSICRGIVERIGEDSSLLKHEMNGEETLAKEVSCPDHYQAIEIIRDVLTDKEKGVLGDISEVSGVGHRVVHGGEGPEEH